MSNQQYKEEANMFKKLSDQGDMTLSEELKTLHEEHHNHKKLTALERKKWSAEYAEEAKEFEKIKAEHGALRCKSWSPYVRKLRTINDRFHEFQDFFETLNGCLPLKPGSVRLETLRKCVSEHFQHFIFST